MTTFAPEYVEAPPVTPLPFGLFSAVAGPFDDLTSHRQMGVQYEPEFCGVAHETEAACRVAMADVVAKTAEDGYGLLVADPFVLYHLNKCRAPGSWDRAEERARRALELGEQRGAEVALGSRLPLATGAEDITPTPGTPVNPVDGVALLEGYSADAYGGVPTIHVPRRVGTVLTTLGTVGRYGARLETVQGAAVASGGGYGALEGPLTDPMDPDTTVPPGAGEAWLYVTGQVVIRRAPTAEVIKQLGTSPAINEFLTLAERPYSVSWECITGAVLVTMAYETPA